MSAFAICTLSSTEEQSRTRISQSRSVEDQPQYRRLWNRRTCARSFSRSRSPRHPLLTQYPFPPRSLVRGGQTSPHKPRLVASHSTCPLSSSPSAQLCTRYCRNRHHQFLATSSSPQASTARRSDETQSCKRQFCWRSPCRNNPVN